MAQSFKAELPQVGIFSALNTYMCMEILLIIKLEI